MKTKRIIMTIHRGPMDATAVCVYPWEKPLLEEVHKGGANEQSIEDMCKLHGPVSVKKQKLPYAADGKKAYAPDLREQLEGMCAVAEDDDPAQDPAAEFARLGAKYGMHPEVKMLVVERVYGSEALFRRMLREFQKATRLDDLDDIIPSRGASPVSGDAPVEEKPAGPSIAEMSRKELMELLKKDDIGIPKNATTETLRELATINALV